jgi:hypothetical protein
MGAVQAQDYNGAKWALGQRLQKVNDEIIEKAFAEGKILRTHVMRPTWHFVSAKDIRWLLQLTAPRVNSSIGSYYRKFELDGTAFKSSRKAIVTALNGGRQLTREALRSALEEAGISAKGLRFIFILARAELDALICSGARQGKQFTYALLDERVNTKTTWERDEALVELTRRYYASHGPATREDFAWWSGLSVADTKAGISMAGRYLAEETLGGKKYWRSSSSANSKVISPIAHLLPTYDEYLIGYRDRSAAFDSANMLRLKSNPISSSPIVINGRVAGIWKGSLRRKGALVELRLFRRCTRNERLAIDEAAERYGEFLGTKVEIAIAGR